MGRPVRIANCSGFYGDRLTAAREMLDGPDPIDVLTGDYLAELTMLILWKGRQKDPGAGYATTFLRQMEDVLGTCLDRGGVAAPQGDDGDTVALIEALGADRVVLVADAGLGTINVVRLSMAALAGWPTVVHLNHYQAECDLHVRNRAWLSDRDGFDVTVSVSDLADRIGG